MSGKIKIIRWSFAGKYGLFVLDDFPGISIPALIHLFPSLAARDRAQWLCFFPSLSPVLGTLNFTFMNGFWLLIYGAEPFLFAESDACGNQSVTCWK